jgi:hypothetical protein
MELSKEHCQAITDWYLEKMREHGVTGHAVFNFGDTQHHISMINVSGYELCMALEAITDRMYEVDPGLTVSTLRLMANMLEAQAEAAREEVTLQ